jgi:two-component system nitrogen regulation response regulator NtrX
MLHARSRRADGPFVALNCATLDPARIEEELFGVEPRGDQPRRAGTLERAHGGTLLLDEVSDMPLETQGKIVRALQEQGFVRMGGAQRVTVDVRVIATTNRDLQAEIAGGRFREDLYYRLAVVPLKIPPLRERREDIPALARYFMMRSGETSGMASREISEDALAAMQAYEWPGNVRELRNVIEGALVMADGVEICPCDLPTSLTTQRPMRAMSLMEQSADLPFVEARERALREFDRAFLAAALARNGGNIARTARALGLHRQSLQKLMARRDLRQPAEMQREL